MQLERPANFPAQLDLRLTQVTARLAVLDGELTPEIAASIARVASISDFVVSVLLRQPEQLIARLLDTAPLSGESLRARIDLSGLAEHQAMSALRRFRQIEMARIAWRDYSGWADLKTNLEDLSTLADTLVQVALDYAAAQLQPRFGRPRDKEDRPASLLVLGMGKLGGRELNYSSDIDLVFLYPEQVVIDGQAGEEAEAYFRRVAQLLIKLLDQVTDDGFVFRVDTRLRPFGTSGPLVVSIAAFESYLTRHGRDWERYAYVKARLLTGLQYHDELFNEILTPFVYRRYLDYGVFGALRQMKKLISEEVQRKDMANNIKLGPGGIREIEFIVQTFQLVRGGRDPALVTPSLLIVLPRLADLWQHAEGVAADLMRAYAVLRITENRLQAMDDRQSHELPKGRERRDRLAYAMNEPDWEAYMQCLNEHRLVVETEFNRVAWEAVNISVEGEFDSIKMAWDNNTLDEALGDSPLGTDPEAIRLIIQLRSGGLYRRMDEPSRQRLAAVIAKTIPLLESRSSPANILANLLPVLQAICRRSAYLSLLNENQLALERLIDLASQSALLARHIEEHPLLLDELLDVRLFDTPPTRGELADSLEQQLANVGSTDMESLLEAMRQFHSAAIFRIAVADRLGKLPLMEVSDRLTDTAELVLEFCLQMAWQELVDTHGKPMYGEPPDLQEAGMAIVGYGKLGGLELAYGSDLDLVFLHNSSGSFQETVGARPVDNTRFFARVVRRLIHFLSVQTSAGRLYEVDTRLRPDGGSGLMVASIDSFGRYQRQDAWTWEHQALLRSRSVAGSESIRAAFEKERLDVLRHHVDLKKLRGDVLRMRLRMRKELSKATESEFDIKQDQGGLADIEFLIDYWVLANAVDFPDLVETPDKIRQLAALHRAGLVTSERCQSLQDAYLALRQRNHELGLNDQDHVVDDSEFRDLRAWIAALWKEIFGADGAA